MNQKANSKKKIKQGLTDLVVKSKNDQIPSPLISLFHWPDILVDSLALLFANISKIFLQTF